jgi:glycine dehydrogenase
VESSEVTLEHAAKAGCNLRGLGPRAVGISFDETTTPRDIELLMSIFRGTNVRDFTDDTVGDPPIRIPQSAIRTSEYLTHPIFNTHDTETEMLRYLKKLESRDLSLTTSMIPLGSCTMKLNATAEMFPDLMARGFQIASVRSRPNRRQATWKFSSNWKNGSQKSPVSPRFHCNRMPDRRANSQVCLAIREYHASRGEAHRNICLIPTSAHGTNPASAIMAGFKVVSVACLKDGDIDLADLRAKADEHARDLAALMVTYPSTHGVFEPTIREICDIVHAHGGQVYMDGANMNAQVGLCRPGDYGADVCHLNLHKTFCIPHGGGGPGCRDRSV